MVQSDVLRGTTKSGKINTKWYFQRLKRSANNSSNINLNKRNSNSTIRVVRGTTATQGLHIPTVFLTSPTKSFENEPIIKKKCIDRRRSSSINLSSATSLKSTSTRNKISPSLSEFNSNSYQSNLTRTNNLKDISSERRSSSSTLISVKPDLIPRPPSTPVDPRCHRAYSSQIKSINRETCALLGPQLCSDCIEIQTRNNLSSERLTNNLIRQRLSALSIRRFIKNQEDLTDDDLLKMINDQQIDFTNKYSNQFHSLIISDEEYFHRLSSSLNQYQTENEFYFKDLKDFSRKYQSNKYKRLLLSETPPPTSSNPIFQQSSFEKFDISNKYSYMKLASTIKPNLKSNSTIFISPKKSQQFYNQHKYLNHYSPPLLLQSLQQTVRKYSNQQIDQQISSTNTNKTQNKSLINSKSSLNQTIEIHFSRKTKDLLKTSTDDEHILTIIPDLMLTTSFIIDDSTTTKENKFLSSTRTSLASSSSSVTDDFESGKERTIEPFIIDH